MKMPGGGLSPREASASLPWGGAQPSPGPRKLHLHPRPSRPLRPRRRQPRGRRRLRQRPHLDRTGPQPPAPYHLRTAHPPLHRKERSRASKAPNRAQSAVEQAEEKARLLVQLAEYEAKRGRNYDPSNDFRPNPNRSGSFFRSPPSSAASSSPNASNRRRSSTGAVATCRDAWFSPGSNRLSEEKGIFLTR